MPIKPDSALCHFDLSVDRTEKTKIPSLMGFYILLVSKK